MKKLITVCAISCLASGTLSLRMSGKEVAHFSMEPQGGKIKETVSGQTFDISSLHGAESLPGAIGNALRFDGYTTYVDAKVKDLIAGSKMTASVWCAVQTYPIVEIDVNTNEMVPIVSCLDDVAKSGFGFYIGFDGRYAFKTYVGGWPLELAVSTPMQRYEWVNLTAVVDCEARTATLYNNGLEVAHGKAGGNIAVNAGDLKIGRSITERMAGPFCLTSFNGIIDDITIWDEALSASEIAGWKAENAVDMSVSAARFETDVMRPRFHGMPGANWTNETHGMYYADGRYHLFFQKNANGPYMARLHWGHISSSNLYDWREEKIAIAPSEAYDIKGCWSGCIFADPAINNGKPTAYYTGVDYAKASIVSACPTDDSMIDWDKTGVALSGRPAGLSDDFRDPYVFKAGDDIYMIVGSSKDGLGTTTLHKYNPTTKSWSNDGKLFFSAPNQVVGGTFWEMPNVTRMGDKYLFTATPLGMSNGVACIYWVGSINADGTFNPDSSVPSYVELSGLAREGYGLLSPTLYQHNGKTLVIGIVPDKLPGQANYELGYAHTYSLPREWTLDAQGKLCQRPYEGLTEMRKEGGYIKSGVELNGSLTLEGIKGRAVELIGEFTVTPGKCGFTLLDDGVSSLKVYYDGATGKIVVDARGLDRLINDSGIFDGLYQSALPTPVAQGETLKLNLFFDHSVLDIFINDKYASSVRVFAHAKEIENVTTFSDLPAHTDVKAWMLNTNAPSSIGNLVNDKTSAVFSAKNGVLAYTLPCAAHLNIYNPAGAKVYSTQTDTNSGRIKTSLKGLHIVEARMDTDTLSQKVIF